MGTSELNAGGGGATLRWTSISSSYSQSLHAKETRISSDLMGHLTHIQTVSLHSSASFDNFAVVSKFFQVSFTLIQCTRCWPFPIFFIKSFSSLFVLSWWQSSSLFWLTRNTQYQNNANCTCYLFREKLVYYCQSSFIHLKVLMGL